MINIEKKLDALIDALGFDVEKVCNECMPVESDTILFDKHYKTEFKLTKRKDPLDVKYNGHYLRQLTKNIIEMECDPTLSKDDKWIYYDKEQFDAVVLWFGDDAVMDGENKCLIFDVILMLDDNTRLMDAKTVMDLIDKHDFSLIDIDTCSAGVIGVDEL